MVLDKRTTLPTRHSYNTASNRTRSVKVAGGKLVRHRVKKAGSIPKCRLCNVVLSGFKAARPFERKRLSKNSRKVSRPYNGQYCVSCLNQRIRRAFFAQEAKTMKKMAAA